MSRQLEPNELFCFGFSHFDCEARRQSEMGPRFEEIVITITMFRGTRYRFFCNPTLTVDEIRELTAYRILDQLKAYHTEVRGYAEKVRKETCQRT